MRVSKEALVQEVTVLLTTEDGVNANISINLSDDAFGALQRVAMLREKSIEDVIVEALRLTQLLANRELLIREGGGRVRELVAV